MIYPAAFAIAVAALILSFRWRTAAVWFGLAAGLVATALGALDLAGLMQPVRPPTAIAIEDVVLMGLGSLAAWSAWRLRV